MVPKGIALLFRLLRAYRVRLSRITEHLSQFGAGRLQVVHERRRLHHRVRDHRSGNFAGANIPGKVLADHDPVEREFAVAFGQSKRFSGTIFDSTIAVSVVMTTAPLG